MEKYKEIVKWDQRLNLIGGHARQSHIIKLQRLDNILKGVNAENDEIEALQGWRRDDSFLGNHADNEIEYKLGYPLISLDGTRAYEFLIEFNVNDPNIGIYYGVKGLTLEGKHFSQIDHFVRDFWGMGMDNLKMHGLKQCDEYPQKSQKNKHANEKVETVRDLIAKYLNATFPGKDFSQRFMFTDNACDHTFWPFWISAEPEEDIVWETARAVSIIRRIYKERADSSRSLYELSDSDCPISKYWKNRLMGIREEKYSDKKSVTRQPEYTSVRKEYVQTIRFTNQVYSSILKKLGNDDNRRFFEQLLAYLIRTESHGSEILKRSTLLENGFEIASRHNRELSAIMRLFFEGLENKNKLEYKTVSDFFEDLSSIFLPGDGHVLTPKNMSNRASEIISSNKDGQSLKPSEEKKLRDLKEIIMKAKARKQVLL